MKDFTQHSLEATVKAQREVLEFILKVIRTDLDDADKLEVIVESLTDNDD